jgi:small multidrug resistance pump
LDVSHNRHRLGGGRHLRAHRQPGFTRLGPSLFTVAGYSVVFYFLSLTLKSIPIGIAYAIWAGLGMVLVTLVGWIRFGQKLAAPALIELILIISGVLVMNLCSKGIAHSRRLSAYRKIARRNELMILKTMKIKPITTPKVRRSSKATVPSTTQSGHQRLSSLRI